MKCSIISKKLFQSTSASPSGFTSHYPETMIYDKLSKPRTCIQNVTDLELDKFVCFNRHVPQPNTV